jgi:hypothetical protein
VDSLFGRTDDFYLSWTGFRESAIYPPEALAITSSVESSCAASAKGRRLLRPLRVSHAGSSLSCIGDSKTRSEAVTRKVFIPSLAARLAASSWIFSIRS